MAIENPIGALEQPVDTIQYLTVDCVIFGLSEGKLQVLIVKHASGDSEGEWGLPGGWVRMDESLEQSATRLLHNYTGMNDVYMEQLKTFSHVNRAPKRVITQAFFALIQPDLYDIAVHHCASKASWCHVHDLPELIYDHKEILEFGLSFLRRKVRYEPIGINLLPKKFTLGQLQSLYEAILDRKLDKPNFRRKMLRLNFLTKCEELQQNVPHRAGALYRFDPEVYEKLLLGGFSFEF